MVQDVAPEVLRVFRVVVIRIVANDDIRVLHGVFDVAHPRKPFHWVFGFWVRTVQKNDSPMSNEKISAPGFAERSGANPDPLDRFVNPPALQYNCFSVDDMEPYEFQYPH